MRRWLLLTLGVLAVLVGVVWTLQGLGHVGGSAMTGERIWAVIGPIVALVGLVLVAVGLRPRQPSRPAHRPTGNEDVEGAPPGGV